MIKNLKNSLLKWMLKVIYLGQKSLHFYKKTDLEIVILIKQDDKHLLESDNGGYKLISIPVSRDDFSEKSPVDIVESFILNDLNKDLSDVEKIEMLDYCRNFDYETRDLKDSLFFRVKLASSMIKSSLKQKYKLFALEDVKVGCFKNKINLFDYKLIIKSQVRE